jgi:NCAIR mutase (PurE)-related protein
MNREKLENILRQVKEGKRDISQAMEELCQLPYADLDFARIDHHRELRTGYPEVVYCAGKTSEQVRAIFAAMDKEGSNIIATRADKSLFEAIQPAFPRAVYYDPARIISIRNADVIPSPTPIAVITAGTSDLPVAEEAAVTAELLGNQVIRIYDAGVAGIHRIFASLTTIRSCSVAIVIAGMEGALASVVGGLVDIPVIAVPTSVGYGAAFQGLASLLGMLNSCAAGVTVVNIDNGFGAGFAASKINRRK